MADTRSELPDRLYEIDALRGIAALCVVVFHFKVMTAHPGGVLGLDTAFGRWGNGYLWSAVDLFFVISGLIFAHVYLRGGRLAPGVTARSYAVARVARIYPLHLATLMIVAVVVWAGAPLAPAFDRDHVRYDLYHFGLNLLMFQAAGFERGFSFNSPAWSLTSEFVCYVLFYVVARIGGRWLMAGAALAVLLGVGADVRPDLIPIPDRIARGLVGFFVGVMLHRHRVTLLCIPFLVTAAVAITALLIAPLLERSGANAGVMMSLFAWPWVVLACLHPSSRVVLRSRIMQLFGDLSFSIYLLHIPLALVFLAINGGRYFTIGQMAGIVPLYMGCLVGISRLSFRWFEEPARRVIRSAGG